MKKYTIKNGSARAIMVGGGPESIIKPGKSAIRELNVPTAARLAAVEGVDVSAYKAPAPKAKEPKAPASKAPAPKEPAPTPWKK